MSPRFQNCIILCSDWFMCILFIWFPNTINYILLFRYIAWFWTTFITFCSKTILIKIILFVNNSYIPCSQTIELHYYSKYTIISFTPLLSNFHYFLLQIAYNISHQANIPQVKIIHQIFHLFITLQYHNWLKNLHISPIMCSIIKIPL